MRTVETIMDEIAHLVPVDERRQTAEYILANEQKAYKTGVQSVPEPDETPDKPEEPAMSPCAAGCGTFIVPGVPHVCPTKPPELRPDEQ